MSLRMQMTRVSRFVLTGMALLWVVTTPARATVITAFPSDFTVPEQSTYSGQVAIFEDDNPAAAPSDFTATIDWGDGSPTTAGTIFISEPQFLVFGQHTYADEGSFTVSVTINDVPPGTGTATATSTATVTEGDALSGTPVTFAAPPGASFTGTVANFSDTLTTAVPSDFTATIDWGDTTISAGTVSGGSGSFAVGGTHTYAAPANYPVTVTLTEDAPGTATATVVSTAKVAAGLSVAAGGFTTPEGVLFSGVVATFSDTQTSFTATIAWGDGTSSPGVIGGVAPSFTVSGSHTYADEDSFAYTVTVTESGPGGATASASGTAEVTETDVLSGSPLPIAAFAMAPFSGPVATFTDTNTTNVPGDFTATIDWGDATTSAGTVTGGGGSFTVSGTHIYSSPGAYTVAVTLTEDAPGTATATVFSTADAAIAPLAAVPTLDIGGLLVLAVALGAAALVALRAAKRRRAKEAC